MEVNTHEPGTNVPGSSDAPSNVSELKPKKPPNPEYSVRMPSIRDAVGLAGVLAEGADNPDIYALIGEDSGDNQAALLLLFTGALRSPRSRDGLLYLLADLWTREVTQEELEIPHDEWEYEPVNDKAPSREQQWKSVSRKNRKRMVKRFEIEDLPFNALMDFGRNLAALEGVEDFLDSLSALVKDGSGKPSTDSRKDTQDGPTE